MPLTRSPCRCGTCYPCDLFRRHPERFAGYVPPPVAEPEPDPEPAPAVAASPPPDPPAAGRVVFGAVGCAGTVIGPRRADGRWDILTAAHCLPAVGERGVFVPADGRALGVTVAALDRRADCGWLVTDDAPADLPAASLAARPAPAGTRVWFRGREGVATATTVRGGRVEFRLEAHPGDSGGAVVSDAGEVVGAVANTTAPGSPGRVTATGPRAAARSRPAAKKSPCGCGTCPDCH